MWRLVRPPPRRRRLCAATTALVRRKHRCSLRRPRVALSTTLIERRASPRQGSRLAALLRSPILHALTRAHAHARAHKCALHEFAKLMRTLVASVRMRGGSLTLYTPARSSVYAYECTSVESTCITVFLYTFCEKIQSIF